MISSLSLARLAVYGLDYALHWDDDLFERWSPPAQLELR